jgi:hypothetical protein
MVVIEIRRCIYNASCTDVNSRVPYLRDIVTFKSLMGKYQSFLVDSDCGLYCSRFA